MKIDPNAPAFPSDEPGKYEAAAGLTIRAHFAAMAMQGMCSYWGEGDELGEWPSERAAQDAVAQADALIAALNAESPND